MAKQTINIGTFANDNTGDTVRDAFDKVNDNFTELYTDDAGDVNSITATAPIARDSATGAVTISLNDAGVTLAKMQNVAANSLLVRDANSSGVLTEKALATTQILIGDGTGMTAAALSGDVTMTNAGAVTIGNDAVTADKLANSINTEIAANTAKVTNATHTGDVTGATALTIADDVISYAKLGAEFTTTDAITTELDFSGHQVFTKTMSGDTTFTFANANIGMVKDFVLTGNHTPTFPAGTKTVSGIYDGTVSNLIQIVAIASGDYWMSISQAI
tara:strand:- start:283 stop:1107 length:825 start_codon:yes stop_codon:yes gene_type:complete